MLIFIPLALLTTLSTGLGILPNIHDDDAGVLLSFRMGLEKHDSLRSWNRSIPLASWAGVTWNGTAAIELQLASFGLKGELSSSNPLWCSLKSLRVLNLTSNSLTGTPFSSKWCSGPSLESLLLARNRLTGQLPRQIHSNTLQELVLRYNSFHGKIPQHLGKRLPALRSLDLSSNSLTGYIPPTLGLLTRLEHLSLTSNSDLHGAIPPSLSSCIKLETLNLANNSISGGLDSLRFPSLRVLNLAKNYLQGRLPDHLCSSSPRLTNLFLSINRLSDSVPQSLHNCTGLQNLLLNENNFTGNIPQELSTLTSLRNLDLSYNLLFGEIPPSILSNCTTLEYFNVAQNQLSGSFPDTNMSRSFVILDFHNNRMSGRLPSTISPRLGMLNLQHNYFTGGIPDTWASSLCSSVRVLDLTQNMLEGSIPSWLGNCTKLFFLSLQSNSFIGTIPPQIGNIPTMSVLEFQPKSFGDCSICPSLTYVHFDSATIQTISNSASGLLSVLKLSHNKLTGSIPHELGNLQGLQALALDNNSLSGAIPPSLSNLTNLEGFLLNNNNLSGTIPSSLASLTFLNYFDVSSNNLQGPIPEGTQFSTFPSASFSGNPGLCGPPLRQSCQSPVPLPQPRADSQEQGVTIPFAIGASVAFPIAFWAAFILLPRYWYIFSM